MLWIFLLRDTLSTQFTDLSTDGEILIISG